TRAACRDTPPAAKWWLRYRGEPGRGRMCRGRPVGGISPSQQPAGGRPPCARGSVRLRPTRGRALGPDLHVGGAFALRPFAETRVVIFDQRLEVIGGQKALEYRFVGELIDGHVLEFVVAQDLPVAPRAYRAVVLQHLWDV